MACNTRLFSWLCLFAVTLVATRCSAVTLEQLFKCMQLTGRSYQRRNIAIAIRELQKHKHERKLDFPYESSVSESADHAREISIDYFWKIYKCDEVMVREAEKEEQAQREKTESKAEESEKEEDLLSSVSGINDMSRSQESLQQSRLQRSQMLAKRAQNAANSAQLEIDPSVRRQMFRETHQKLYEIEQKPNPTKDEQKYHQEELLRLHKEGALHHWNSGYDWNHSEDSLKRKARKEGYNGPFNH